MTFTPTQLRNQADRLSGGKRLDVVMKDLAAMLRAGADAMEREKQARDQALEEAAALIENNILVDTSDGQALRPRGEGNRFAVAYASAIRALKGDTINGEKLTEDDLQFFLDQDNQGEPQ